MDVAQRFVGEMQTDSSSADKAARDAEESMRNAQTAERRAENAANSI